MKKYLAMFGAAGLLAAMMMIGGCGSDDSNYYHGPVVTTTAGATTTTAGGTTTTAGGTTTTAAATTTTAAGGTTTTAAVTTTTSAATTTTTTTTTTLPPAVNVSTGGTSDASASVVSYVFAAGNYTYTIAGFGTGDKLTFPAGVAPTVLNTSFSDNNVIVQWAFSGNTISVVLTGLTNDSSLNSVNNFNTVFGAGTIN